MKLFKRPFISIMFAFFIVFMWSGGTFAGSDTIYTLKLEPYYGATSPTGTSTGCTMIPLGGTSVFTATNNASAGKNNTAIDLLGINSEVPVRYPTGIFTIQVDTLMANDGTIAASGSTVTLSYQISNKNYATDAEWALSGTTDITDALDVRTGNTGYVYSFNPPGGRFLRILGESGLAEVRPTLILWIQ